MKVICINDNWNPAPTPETPCPNFWEECEVIKVETKLNRLWYVLAGYPLRRGYSPDNFAILPDSSADEMREEKHEAIIYQ
jgi:hypothetical protein